MSADEQIRALPAHNTYNLALLGLEVILQDAIPLSSRYLAGTCIAPSLIH